MATKRNWAEYNEMMVNRGSVLTDVLCDDAENVSNLKNKSEKVVFWFNDDVLKLWNSQKRTCKRGRPFLYTDSAIETTLLVRDFFKLSYRNAEGIGRAMLSTLGVQKAAVPDYSSIYLRSKTLNVADKIRDKRGPLEVLVDAKGIKVFGRGERKNFKRSANRQGKQRTLVVAFDPATRRIVVAETVPGAGESKGTNPPRPARKETNFLRDDAGRDREASCRMIS